MQGVNKSEETCKEWVRCYVGSSNIVYINNTIRHVLAKTNFLIKTKLKGNDYGSFWDMASHYT